MRVLNVDDDPTSGDYLAKPCEFDELLACLRALCRRCQNSPGSATLTAGASCLDPAHFSAWRADRPLGLTRTEFALLAALPRPRLDVRTRHDPHIVKRRVPPQPSIGALAIDGRQTLCTLCHE